MLRHRLTALRGNLSGTARNSQVNEPVRHQNNMDHKDLDTLHGLSRSGLWGLLAFLVASAIALYFREHTLTASLPAGLMEQLGSKPPVILINIIFGVSTLSSLIIIAGRLHKGRRPSGTWTHLFFRIAFYLLYFSADSLSGYFNTVFISGMTVLALQHYNAWNYYGKLIEIRASMQENLGRCIQGR